MNKPENIAKIKEHIEKEILEIKKQNEILEKKKEEGNLEFRKLKAKIFENKKEIEQINKKINILKLELMKKQENEGKINTFYYILLNFIKKYILIYLLFN